MICGGHWMNLYSRFLVYSVRYFYLSMLKNQSEQVMSCLFIRDGTKRNCLHGVDVGA